MDEGFVTEFSNDLKAEFEMCFELFKNSCEDNDYEFGMRVWNELMKFNFILYDEKEVRERFYAIASEPFHSANAQKWFIRAHVAYRKWQAQENSKQIDQLNDEIIKFQTEREWKKFHTPENLAKSISIEAAELLEHFQWGTGYEVSEVSDELADVLIYCFYMADSLNLDIKDIIRNKMEKNAIKYPVDKAKGNAKKYTELL